MMRSTARLFEEMSERISRLSNQTDALNRALEETIARTRILSDRMDALSEEQADTRSRFNVIDEKLYDIGEKVHKNAIDIQRTIEDINKLSGN